jgi:integrase
MAKVLTLTRIEAAKAKDKRYELPDAGLPGFYLIVQPRPSNAKSFCLRYRAGGKPRKLTLGAYPGLTLEAARKQAREALIRVAEGKDPGTEKIAARCHAQAKPDGVPRTIAELAAAFVKDCNERKRKPLRPRTLSEYARTLNRDVLPLWGSRSLSAGGIKRREIEAVLTGIAAEYPVKANRVAAVLHGLFSWGVKRGFVDVNPCTGIERPAETVERERVLDASELRTILRAAAKLPRPAGLFVQMLAITLQRRNEVSGLCWSEINVAEGKWTLPGSRAKNKQSHIIPLPPAAMEILNQVERWDGCDFVFSIDGKTPFRSFSGLKRAIDALATEENGGCALAHWTFHDLRRTGASKMPELGVSLPAVERLLNHIGGSFAGIVKVYQRYDFAKEARAALEGWAKFLDRLAHGGNGNVARIEDYREMRQG